MFKNYFTRKGLNEASKQWHINSQFEHTHRENQTKMDNARVKAENEKMDKEAKVFTESILKFLKIKPQC